MLICFKSIAIIECKDRQYEEAEVKTLWVHYFI